MEDFLKNRPVLDPKSALIVAAEPKLSAPAVKAPSQAQLPTAATSPFNEIRRDGQAPVAAAGKPAAATAPAAFSAAPATPAQTLKGEHGTKVQTIVERGRVTRIIVTCTCGKVTEIACQY